jgi:hypothetical protein
MAKYWDDTVLTEIVDLLIRKELYLFAGAGLSVLAGLPTWDDLLDQIAQIYITSPFAKPEIAREIQHCKRLEVIDLVLNLDVNAKRDYCTLLGKNFTNTTCYHTCHQILLELPFSGYVTTNYDLCFENCCQANSYPRTQTILNHCFAFPKHVNSANYNVSGIWSTNPFLLHMHGQILLNSKIDVKNIVLSTEQYNQHYNNPEMKIIFDNCLQKNVLILGASLTDEWFMNKFWAQRGIGDINNIANRKCSYIICHESELPKDPTIKKLVYDVAYNGFTDYTTGILDMLTELKDEYKNKTTTII